MDAMTIGLAVWIFALIFVVRYAVRLQKEHREDTRKVTTSVHARESSTDTDPAEVAIERALTKALHDKGYVIFGNLIIPSISGKIRSTQIDHVVISKNGIFCIETKSHKGSIYGGVRNRNWVQYLGRGSKYSFHSPIQQNKHHVASLEYLLRNVIKAPIHSYVVFPNANKVKVDGHEKDLSIEATIQRILSHQRPVYRRDEAQNIAKGLAFVSSKSDDFAGEHVQAVQEYLGLRTR